MSFVFPGNGTGALSSLRIHVSISLISHAISEDICSVEMLPDDPVKMPQTVSRWLVLDDEPLAFPEVARDEDEGDEAGEDLEDASDRA